jgi:hypothetical protein
MECLYYTDSIIRNKRTLAQLCFLFEKVRLFNLLPNYFLSPLEERWEAKKHTPFFAKSPCEKQLFTRIHFERHKEFIEENRELVDADILQPILVQQTPPDWESFEANERKLMTNGVGLAFGIWGQSVGIVPNDKVYVDAPWFSLYRLQSISGALHFAIARGQTPISDNPTLSRLAIDAVTKFSGLNYRPTRKDLAENIAFRSLSLLVPGLPLLHPQEILRLRDELSDELRHFRTEVYRLSHDIAEIDYEEIESLIRDNIQPRLDDLKLKIASLKSETFRKIAKTFLVGGGATPVLSHFINLPAEGQIPVIASFIGKILVDIHQHNSRVKEIRNLSRNRGLIFLITMQKRFKQGI